MVLEILKENGGAMFAAEVAEKDADLFDKGSRSVSPILVTLARKGFIDKPGKADLEVLDKDGNKVTRSYTQYIINSVGSELVYETKA